MHGPPKLLDQVRYTLRLKHYSLDTERSYVQWIRRYILFHDKKHSKDMNAEHIRDYLSYLATTRKVAASTQNQALQSSYWFLVLSCWFLGDLTDLLKLESILRITDS